jgi:hypothetical protein
MYFDWASSSQVLADPFIQLSALSFACRGCRLTQVEMGHLQGSAGREHSEVLCLLILWQDQVIPDLCQKFSDLRFCWSLLSRKCGVFV